jgi:hypothetical protein
MKHVILCYADTIKLNPDISLFECYTLTGQRTDAFQLSQKWFERIRNTSFFSNQNMYFASKNLPCKQTATTLCSQAIPLGALNQVLHNFEDFSNKDDWNWEELPPEKQVLLREKSLQLFFENRLWETQENVALRFQEIEHIAQTSMRPCIFIAPGFVVTLFKIYKKTNHFQNTNPETIKKLACLHEPFGKPLEWWSWEE